MDSDVPWGRTEARSGGTKIPPRQPPMFLAILMTNPQTTNDDDRTPKGLSAGRVDGRAGSHRDA
jgi:hypothetical protein